MENEIESPLNKTVHVRPWVRYWARYFDITLFGFVYILIAALFFPLNFFKIWDYILEFTTPLFWIFFESIMLVLLGTTPGKFILNTRLLVTNDKEINITQALSRSFKVWWRGLGIGVPIIALFTQIVSYSNLKKTGKTHWDRATGFDVEHGEIGVMRIILFVFLFSITIGLSIPFYSNIVQRIDYDLEMNDVYKIKNRDLPKMLDSITRWDSSELHDGEIYYKYSLLLVDDQKMDYSKLKQMVKIRACINEDILGFLDKPSLRLINTESKVHFHYTEENSKKITIFSLVKSDCI